MIRPDPVKSAARKARRLEKRAETAAIMALNGSKTAQGAVETMLDVPGQAKLSQRDSRGRKRKIRRLSKRGTLKARIVRLLGLLDAKYNGQSCRMIPYCPDKMPHNGTLAYHLVPAQRGDSTRFLRENVVWACARANCGEVYNRSLYRQHHVYRFGRERIDRLEALAREHRKFTRTELDEMRRKLKAELEA